MNNEMSKAIARAESVVMGLISMVREITEAEAFKAFAAEGIDESIADMHLNHMLDDLKIASTIIPVGARFLPGFRAA